ncbi:MAG: glutamate formimidoyltransferase [Chloroflexi bacterium]|nr:glutamate formimidoyltransferase [Chloroflexota bacterium]
MLVECVPNFSEGRRPAVVAEIEAAVRGIKGVWLLDRHADWAHNRTVLTFAGAPDAVAEAAFQAVATAAGLIDMGQHEGVHPRIGATDVVPFVPLMDTPMSACIELAERVGERIGAELGIPVYLYAEAAQRPERRWLPTVRRGEIEALRREIASNPERAPDFGPRQIGSAGATAVGARPALIAFNVNLASGDLSLARRIAKTIRQSSGGLPAVQARGLATARPDRVQVSTNLLDFQVTPLHQLFARIAELADAAGIAVAESEVVGLLPTEALTLTTAWTLRVAHMGAGTALEHRLLRAVLESETRQAG